jgi:hypothetical protein
MASRINLLGSAEWQRATHVRPVGAPIHPLMQIKIGHLSMLISAGELGVVRLETPTGPALVKGMLQKYTTEEARPNVNHEGEVVSYTVEQKEHLASVITLVKADGERETISGAEAVSAFVSAHAGPLADAILAKNEPFYRWDPTPREWHTVSRCALGLPPLPGRTERGLFEVQKHFAIAAARKLCQGGVGEKAVITMAEMGYGKSATTVGALEVYDRWPALVLCPDHMPHKWRRELELGSDPQDPITARVITRPARAEIAWFAERIAPVLAEYGAELVDDYRYQVTPESNNDTGGRRRLTVRVARAQRDLCLRRLQRNLTLPASRKDGTKALAPKTQLTPDGFVIEGADRDDYTLEDFFRDYTTGTWQVGPKNGDSLDASFTETIQISDVTMLGGDARVGDRVLVRFMRRPDGSLFAWEIRTCVPKTYVLGDNELIVYVKAIQTRLGRKAVAVVTFAPAKYDAGPVPVQPLYRWVTVKYEDEKHTVVSVKAKAACCPQCGYAFGLDEKGQKRREADLIRIGQRYELRCGIPDTCPHLIPEPVLDEKGQVVKDAKGRPQVAYRACRSPLFAMNHWRRVGVARLVQKKYAHRFKVYIADELHKCQAGDSDIGVADSRLLSGIAASVSLTGTLFGGTASSLFYLLYRRNPDVRRLYPFKDVNRWIDHYGRWKRTWTQNLNANHTHNRGAHTGVERWNERPPQELPGVSPAVARFLLPITLFGKITDLGYHLPPLEDQVELVPMGKALGAHYKATSDRLVKLAMQRLEEDHDPGLLSVWFATCRYRPMSAFRDEDVTYKGERVLALPRLLLDDRDPLPKEERLAEKVKANIARGRKTLVFVEQTGTRDIRGRLADVLARRVPGVNVQQLSASDMKPAKRELWIKRNAPRMDVLLVNATLVETGLDLVMFSDIIFFETNTSLYSVWQSMRRVWRLGQRNNVTTTFLAYSKTVEESLLEIMGEKMKAAMLLYGDDAAGALIENDGDEDLAREMIKRALTGKSIECAGEMSGRSLFGSPQTCSLSGPADLTATGMAIEAQPTPETDNPMSMTTWITEPLQSEDPKPVQLDLFGGLVRVETNQRR